MRKLLFMTLFASALSLSVPIDLSFANTRTNKHVVQGKAKHVVSSSKKKAQVASTSSKKVKKTSTRKKVVYKRPRYASNVNKPQEGDSLKLEGMVKDLNEQ